MLLNEEERNIRFQEKYGVLDLYTSYVSLSQHPSEAIDKYSARVVAEAALNIAEYNQPFEANFLVGLNGKFLSQIKQIYFNIEYQNFNGKIKFNQIDHEKIVSRDEITAPIDSEGIFQINCEIPELIAPARGFFTVSFIFEVDDPEFDETYPTLIGYNVCRVPVQVSPGEKDG